MRRVLWMTVGAASGFVAAVWALAGVRRARTHLHPTTAPTRLVQRVHAAVDEGRDAKRAYELEAARRHGLA